MVAPPAAHPQVSRLAAFGLGQLSAREAKEVEEHLGRCEPCARRLDTLPADGFVSALRGAARVSWATPAIGDPPPLPHLRPVEETLPAELAAHPKYRVRELLGRGGMGTVYRAEHTLMERPVALKVIALRLLEKPGSADRFKQEVRAAARLHHPNIVAAFDAEHVGPVTVLAMEYVEGRTLAEHIRDRGPLPAVAACDYARQAALGLAHAHALGMVHRDVKPANLMLTPDGRVKILDFGLARFVSEAAVEAHAGPATSPVAEPALTATGACMGTLDYVAPEQADDAHTADGRADIYALGATLYHLLAGRVPFHGGSVSDKLDRLAVADPTPLAAIRPDLPAGLVRVVERMMAKRPEARFTTAQEVAEALAPFAAGQPPERRPHRRRLVIAALVIGLIVAAGVVLRLKTEQGVVVIETDDPDVEVVVKGERIVTIRDPMSGRSYVLDRGDLTLSQADGDGVQVTLDGTKPVVLKRNGAKIATVRLDRLGSAAVAAPATARSTPRLVEVRRHSLPPLTADSQAPHNYVSAFAPDGSTIASGGDDGLVRIWDARTGELRQTLRGHTGHPSCLAFTPDGRYLLCGDGDRAGTIRVWDAATGAAVHSVIGHAGGVESLDMTQHGALLVTAGDDGVARIWDLRTWAEVRTFLMAADETCGAAFGSAGRDVITWSGGNTVRRWNAATGALLATSTGPAASVLDARLVAGGKSLIVVTGDGLSFRDPATLTEVRRMSELWPAFAQRWFIHWGVSPDGRFLVAAREGDPAASLWDLTSGAGLGRLPLPARPSGRLAFSPDGRQIACGGFRGFAFQLRIDCAPELGRVVP